MVVTKFDLKLANYVQDKGQIDFDSCVELYGKSKSTMKRSIYTLNEYLPDHLHFSISHHEMKTNMTYADFASLCKKLELKDYATSLKERLALVMCKGFLQGIINMTQLYKKIDLSLSTKKKDRKELGYLLNEKDVEIINRHRQGIKLKGNERFLRMYVARELISVIELDRNDHFIPRKANTPVQKLLYSMFEEHLADYHEEVIRSLELFFEKTGKTVDYASKKFIYIHSAISLMRIREGHSITMRLKDMPEVPQHNLLPEKEDSQYMDYLVSSLNFKTPLNFPYDSDLHKITESLIQVIEADVSIKFHTYKALHDELYAYMYKCHIKNKLDYYFYDDKLDDTKYVFPKLFELIKTTAADFKDCYELELTEHQVSVICLIAERFIIKNRLVEKNKPNILIITNSSVEKVNFFLEVLTQHINFETASHLTINELYKLEHLEFDKIITFSNRITVLLNELGWESIKLNFYLSSEDIKKLLDSGFTSSRNGKILIEEVVEDLMTKKTKEEMTHYFKTNLSDYMI